MCEHDHLVVLRVWFRLRRVWVILCKDCGETMDDYGVSIGRAARGYQRDVLWRRGQL